MKLLAGSQSKMTVVLIKKGNLDTVMNKGKRMEKTYRKASHIQAKQRRVEKTLPLESLEGTNSANTFRLDFQLPEL